MSWYPVRLSTPKLSGRADGSLVCSSLARLIASGAADSKIELATATGLARSTVNNHLDDLVASGLVTETGLKNSAGRGRPAHRLTIAPHAGAVLVADVGAHTSRLAVTDLAQQVLAERQVSLDISVGPEHALADLTTYLNRLLTDAAVAAHAVRVLVMGLPGPVDSQMGVPVRPPIMPGWDRYPVGQTMSERFNCAAVIDNDVNLMALGEARALGPAEAPLLFVKIGTGIGGGIVSADGQLHRGADGAAGDLGHIRVPGADDVVCQCGNVGCIEAVASAGAVLRGLQTERPMLTSITDLASLLRDGDPIAIRRVRTAAETTGEVVAALVHFYNPKRIVLGGAVPAATDDVLAGIRSVVYRRALPLATRHLSVANSQLGPFAGLAGGTVSGIEHTLSPPGIADIMARPLTNNSANIINAHNRNTGYQSRTNQTNQTMAPRERFPPRRGPLGCQDRGPDVSP